MRRNFQDLTIKDAFMFAAVMSDENQCRKLLEIVLETKILHVTVITEKTMSYHPDYHGVRLDVVAEEEGGHRRFNVEMQVKRTPDLAWRSRYYHSQLDMDALLSGEVYDALRIHMLSLSAILHGCRISCTAIPMRWCAGKTAVGLIRDRKRSFYLQKAVMTERYPRR